MLVEGMAALLILSFGILGLSRFQVGMIAQTTDAQTRLQATSLTEELLSQVRVDGANAACYTLPQQGACGSAIASQHTAKWATRAMDAGFETATVALPAANRLTATLTWTSKAFQEIRTHTVTTDARP